MSFVAGAPKWILMLGLIVLSSVTFCWAKNSVTVWPLDSSQTQSSDYQVEAGGKTAFVSTAAVLRGEPASFSSFDFSGTVLVKITSTSTISSFKILPSSLGIQGTVNDNQLTFTMSQAANLTIELNGSMERPLHLFAGILETNIPSAKDANVIYFGPGIHEISTIQPKTGQTVYLAPGCVLKAIIPDNEQPVEVNHRDGTVENIYHPLIEAGGVDRVTIRGRGIIDMSGLPWHARKAMWFDSSTNIIIEGITLLDSADWGIVLNQCSTVIVRNIREISPRENSDGIDICNSRNVTVDSCFIRSNDDAISVKTLSPAPAMKSDGIKVRRCVIWNERARALGITSETLADISNVAFSDCDIIHDLSEGGDCAALAVLVSDSGTMSNISFSDIRIEDSRTKLIRCWIGEDGWAQDSKRGHIKGVTFQKIAVTGNLPVSEVFGYDRIHLAESVTLNLQVNGQKITRSQDANLQVNDYVTNVRVLPN